MGALWICRFGLFWALFSFFLPCVADAAPLYRLIQVSYRSSYSNEVFFIPAGQDGACFTSKLYVLRERSPLGPLEKVEVHGSNVLVSVHGKLVEALPGIEAWVDESAHVHTIVALKQQNEYRFWLAGNTDCSSSGCELSAGRSRPFRMRPVSLTGILDRETTTIPLMRLEYRYDAAYRAFLKDCASVSPSGCTPPWPNGAMAYWAGTLDKARFALDRLAEALAKIPFFSPPSGNWGNLWRDSAPGNPYGGLELPAPDTYGLRNPYKVAWQEIVWGADRGEALVIYPDENEPEKNVKESADARAIDAEVAARIEAAQRDAEAAVSAAESLAPPEENPRTR